MYSMSNGGSLRSITASNRSGIVAFSYSSYQSWSSSLTAIGWANACTTPRLEKTLPGSMAKVDGPCA